MHTRGTIPTTGSAAILDVRGIRGVLISVSRNGSREALREVFVEEELHGTDMAVLSHYAPAHQWYATFLLAVQDEAFTGFAVDLA